MDQTGFLHELTTSLSRSWDFYQLKETTLEAKAYHESLKETQQLFKTATTAKDPVLLTLLTEKVCLQQELETYSNSKEMAGSIKTALTQLAEAQASFQVIQQPAVYKQLAATFSSKRKVGGLPQDAFREFVKSHQTRLTNTLKSSLSQPEKGLLRQRKANLKAANEFYMELQRKALGLNQENELAR